MKWFSRAVFALVALVAVQSVAQTQAGVTEQVGVSVGVDPNQGSFQLLGDAGYGALTPVPAPIPAIASADAGMIYGPPVGRQAHQVTLDGAKQTANGYVSSTIGGVFHVVCRDAKGNVEWSVDVHNTLGQDGANYLRDMFFKANSTTLIANAPFIGLLTATPTTATTLSTMTEATGTGYSRKAGTWVTTNPGSANNTASQATWTAGSGGINAVTYLFLTNASSGTSGYFMAFAALTGGPYTINSGSILNVSYTWTVA